LGGLTDSNDRSSPYVPTMTTIDFLQLIIKQNQCHREKALLGGILGRFLAFVRQFPQFVLNYTINMICVMLLSWGILRRSAERHLSTDGSVGVLAAREFLFQTVHADYFKLDQWHSDSCWHRHTR